jgi:uncharacterized membrane protein YfcA
VSLEPLEIVLLIFGGLAGGFINTLAGGGSAVTIPILTEIVGISVANGTNRIAIMAANLTAIAGFQKGKAVPWSQVLPLLPPAMFGAAFGAWTATGVDEGVLRRVFALVLLLVAASVLTKPSRWIEERENRLPEPWRSIIFFGIGFYGGFVQAGVGFMLLAGLVLGGGLDLVKGNAAKVVLIASYTPIAIIFFASASQIDLTVGVVMALGQMSGAWIAARLALKRGAGWVRWILVAAAVVASIRLAFF